MFRNYVFWTLFLLEKFLIENGDLLKSSLCFPVHIRVSIPWEQTHRTAPEDKDFFIACFYILGAIRSTLILWPPKYKNTRKHMYLGVSCNVRVQHVSVVS